MVIIVADNMAAWERFENKERDLTAKLDGADKELEDIKKVSCLSNSFAARKA